MTLFILKPQFVALRNLVLSPYRTLSILCLSVLTCLGTAYAQKSIDLNAGVTPAKSILGLSYTHGRNQINAGLHGFAYHSNDGGFVMPGIAYNRYLTKSGFYATANYNFYYADYVERTLFMNNGNLEIKTEDVQGWRSGVFGTGLGKSFQFTRWGLHVDGGLATPATSEFGQVWGWWLGGAASYRFKLGD